MSDELIYSGIGSSGRQSPRSYTRAELAAGKRLGVAHNDRSDGRGGPLYWGVGSGVRDDLLGRRAEAEKTIADIDLILPAMDREWDKPW